jgi:hypothetical protein
MVSEQVERDRVEWARLVSEQVWKKEAGVVGDTAHMGWAREAQSKAQNVGTTR